MMQFNQYSILALLASVAYADVRLPLHVKSLTTRDTCPSGDKVCGTSSCIPLSYTCCPSGDGGCPAGYDCEKGDNGEYGCCPVGKNCSGDGGVNTRTVYESYTSDVATTNTATSTYATGAASTCAIGRKPCGTGCINSLYTCCPDGSGGCGIGDECQQDTNGNWGCCAIGEDCVGTVSGAYTTATSRALTTSRTSTYDYSYYTDTEEASTSTSSTSRSTFTTPRSSASASAAVASASSSATQSVAQFSGAARRDVSAISLQLSAVLGMGFLGLALWL